MGEQKRRIGLNETVFREVNERLRDLNMSFTTLSEHIDLICECADTRCTEHVSMSPLDYERLRSDPRRFVVKPGHELGPEVERVVERGDESIVVEKRGDAARAAEQSDPRAGDH